ncbi:multidrug ABC transporter ATP-binding protein [Gallibacterium salpingitidis]|uniref:Multidrug ABC transporter ATP-binding protein n=1 Tax=Gallibacterium salpingitidis TaxID=505341 RepID=A0AB36E527_9PAST|nr:ATP-binding cassette domain-containing protein [Gallibacterium salpingitidis]OBX07151.1 multidrug ABC transporter ATP-binding protein [Gallibacterium salpingitidis]OBX12119.1 multidrug ABC transporter ATP-binding protein [Gallibacterium salpingitidis]
MTQPIVVIDSVSKHFKGMDTLALDHISAQIYPGKITGLVGPDGAGKTTLIRHLIGLMQPDSGTITVDHFDIVNQAEAIHEISGYMPQKFGLYEDLTVIENLSLYADLRGIAGKNRQEKFEKLLSFTDLAPFQQRLAGKLSGGMKQKLGLACALVGDPKLLLLDEPSVGVDPISRRELWKLVQELVKEGMAVLWSTAYLDEAEKCDSVILLNEGKKLYDGDPQGLLARVENRVYQVTGVPAEERRKILIKLLQQPQVMDGIIQGSNIRLVLHNSQEKPVLEQGQWLAVNPCFEDAFIDCLGGGPGGNSALAAKIEHKSDDGLPVIDAKQLTKRFGTFVAVKDNTFSIKRGEIFGLLGPNGAGKSTTFKMMCGLLQPTSGECFVTGLDLRHATSLARSKIGYMAQKFSLYSNLDVLQNLRFFAGLYGVTGKVQRERIAMMIDIFDFQPYLRMNAGDLPLGFKQRLSLACAVIHQPDILFLDEPTSGVDPITRREFWLHINAMVGKGVTVMVTTHFMDEAEYCDRIGLIYRGENIATGTPDELKQQAKQLAQLDSPTLEDAFIALVQAHDQQRKEA